MGGDLSALRSSDCLSPAFASEQPTGECSAISLLFQVEYGHMITCGSCHYESASQEPFTVLSLSIPTSGECTLTNLMENSFRDCSIEYRCPVCNKNRFSVRRTLNKKLPPILMIHLDCFEYNISSRKKQNYVDFPLEQLNLSDQASKDKNVSYNLCAVLNHYGSMNSGHYTSYCKPSQENIWYHCDDKAVTRLIKPVKTYAYQFFTSQQFKLYFLSVPLVPFCDNSFWSMGG